MVHKIDTYANQLVCYKTACQSTCDFMEEKTVHKQPRPKNVKILRRQREFYMKLGTRINEVHVSIKFLGNILT